MNSDNGIMMGTSFFLVLFLFLVSAEESVEAPSDDISKSESSLFDEEAEEKPTLNLKVANKSKVLEDVENFEPEMEKAISANEIKVRKF